MDAQYDGRPRQNGLLFKSRLINVISDLKNGTDIKGAALIGDKDRIIVSDLPKGNNYPAEIPEILSRLRYWHDSTLPLNGMFAHCIIDYNGGKVLAKILRENFMLLVLLEKTGYVGLAMLDIENSVREINGILNGGVSKKSAYS